MAKIATRGDGIMDSANGRNTSTYPSIVTFFSTGLTTPSNVHDIRATLLLS